MKKLIVVASFFSCCIGSSIAQVTIHGVTLPEKLGREDKVCILNGAGVKKHYFISIYVAGLYLKNKNTNPNAIINDDQVIAVRMQIISSLVTKDRMCESIKEGFNKSTGGNTAPIQKEIDMIVKIFQSEEIKVGDVFDIWYFPGKGVMASKNAEKLDLLIPGLYFKKSLFDIWLGENSADKELKESMLGFCN